MAAGIPVITPDYGDVAMNSGEEFIVNDYSEMLSTILRYKDDAGYYEDMAARARRRATKITDIKGSIIGQIREIEFRERMKFE